MKHVINQSVKHAAFIRGNHVLNVNKSVLSASLFQQLKGLRNQVSQVGPLSLVVLHLVTDVCVVIPENVENWKNLPVIWHQRLSNHFPTQYQLLNDL